MLGTTSEERLLQLTGYIGPDGALRAGSRVHLAFGVMLREAKDGERLVITAGSSSPAVEGPQRALAMASVIARMARPGSERASWRWLCERSALGELLGVDFDPDPGGVRKMVV